MIEQDDRTKPQPVVEVGMPAPTQKQNPKEDDYQLQNVVERNAAAQPDIITSKVEPLPLPKYDPAGEIERLADRIAALEAEQHNALLRQYAPKPSSFSFGGFTFSLLLTPKQDAVVAGENKVGRDGILLQAQDGERTFVLARMEWDHRRNAFVLYTGQGVTG